MIEKTWILAADEVGYGSWAGSLCIGAIKAPTNWSILGLNDSKKLTDKQRRKMNVEIRKSIDAGDIQFTIVERTNKQIDSIGLGVCLKECYKEVAEKLYTPDSLIIIDGNVNFSKVLIGMDYQTVIKADTIYPAVMAASIIAKVYRDDKMIELAKQFPNYGFDKNKGYGSINHLDAIRAFGYSEYHRKSYKIKL